MKRIISVLAVVAVMAALMVVSAMPAFAFANPDSKGGRGQGQARAVGNCDLKVIPKQASREQEAGGGPKSGSGEEYPVPTNCDHLWQENGFIGNQ
jgi:hypothetical protein